MASVSSSRLASQLAAPVRVMTRAVTAKVITEVSRSVLHGSSQDPPDAEVLLRARLACSDVLSGRDLEQTWPTSGTFLVWPAHVISVWFPVTSEDQVILWVVTITAGRRLTGHRFGCGHAACEGS